MPEGRHTKPQVPYVEDFDSDENDAKPGTKREALKRSDAPPKSLGHAQKLRNRDAASDSGYSSHTSNTVASSSSSQPPSANLPTSQNTQQSAITRSLKPSVDLGDQQRPSRLSRSTSVSRSDACSDPNCGNPECASSRSTQRQFVLPNRPQSHRSNTLQYPVQDPAASARYAQPAPYQYAQPVAPQQMPNYPPQPEPRARTSSTSRSRPVSWTPGNYNYPPNYPYGSVQPQGTYGTPHHGPPPAQSACHHQYMAQYPTMNWQANMAQLNSGSPRDSYGSYLPQSSGNAMLSSSPNAAYPPSLPQTYSARQGNPATSNQEVTGPSAPTKQLSQSNFSARRSSMMPGSFPDDSFLQDPGSASSESESDAEYDDRYHDERRDRERERARRELEAKRAMPPPPARRPSMRHSRTTPTEARHHSREPVRRARYSEPELSTSDYVESNRAARRDAERHSTYYSERSDRDSRQHSIPHPSSGGRHKSSSVSQGSRPAKQYIVEDTHGRKHIYPTREQAESKARSLEQQQREDAAEAYQAKMGGGPSATLTTENVKRMQPPQHEKKPSSHVSGSSRKSGASGSRLSKTESTIQIQRGETVFSIPVNTTLEVRQTEEGETWFIGSSSPPREKGYHGSSSKSSSSRRSRTGSEIGRGRRDTIQEENGGYERAL